MKNHLLVPFLTGQWREGLCRVAGMNSHAWDILTAPNFTETDIADVDEKLRRMGKIYGLLSKTVKVVVDNGLVPVSVAGDCISTLGVLGGLQQAGKTPDRLLWLDAHGDFHTWKTTQTNYLGGMPLAMLVGRFDGSRAQQDAIGRLLAEVGVMPYPEERIILSDARDLDPGEIEAIRHSKIVQCDIADILEHIIPGENLYVHWDTDVLDAANDMPALKYHVNKGPTYSEMSSLFQSLHDADIVAISVSAWHAETDRGDKTALACLKLLEMLEQ